MLSSKTVLAAAASLLCVGCYYGTMQPAHTLGENHITATGSFMLPAFLEAEERAEAEQSGVDYLEPYPSLSLASGATDNVDIGISAYGYGLGPFLKYSPMESSSPAAISALAGVGCVLPAGVISVRGSLAAGHRLGSRLQLYGAWDVGYGPDLANVPEDQEGEDDWDAIGNTTSQALRLGVGYELRMGPDMSGYVPESVSFELTVPLDLSRDMVIAGLGVTY